MARYELTVQRYDLSPPDGDGLLTLAEAARLSVLGGQFDERQLTRAALSGRLRTTQPTGRQRYVTRAAIIDWISTCPNPGSPQGFGSTPSTKSGRSSTVAESAASASLRLRLAALKRPSKPTS